MHYVFTARHVDDFNRSNSVSEMGAAPSSSSSAFDRRRSSGGNAVAASLRKMSLEMKRNSLSADSKSRKDQLLQKMCQSS